MSLEALMAQTRGVKRLALIAPWRALLESWMLWWFAFEVFGIFLWKL